MQLAIFQSKTHNNFERVVAEIDGVIGQTQRTDSVENDRRSLRFDDSFDNCWRGVGQVKKQAQSAGFSNNLLSIIDFWLH